MMFAADRTLIIAHRGYRACYPENTFCAFTASLGRCAMIEFDVQLSRDGIPVVMHDASLERTTNAKDLSPELRPSGLALKDWSLAELQQLDAGSWFLRDDPFASLRHGQIRGETLQALMPQRIMPLEQVLSWALAKGIPLNVELKAEQDPARSSALVTETIRLIRLTKTGSQILLSSFQHECLRHSRQGAPEIATAALQEGAHPRALIRSLKQLGVRAYHPADATVDQALIETIRRAGLAINIFTVNDPERQLQLTRWGATGIFTDYPRQPYLVPHS